MKRTDLGLDDGSVKGQILLAIQRGVEIALRNPWLGHGLEAAYSPDWLSNNFGFFTVTGRPMMLHSGFVDYLIIGGFPLFLMFMTLFAWMMTGLWKLAARVEGVGRDLAVTGLVLNIHFVATVFSGDIFPKFGWWMFGFGRYMARNTSTCSARSRPIRSPS